MEEFKSLLDWIAEKDLWYWITIAFALSIARGFLKTLFSPIVTAVRERAKRVKPVRKAKRDGLGKAEPTGKWAKYQ